MAHRTRRFPFVQVDVFTAEPLAGNPLAVFTDGRGLSGGEMQALAREMNLSETTFVVPRDPEQERERGVRVRIFTVREELPFAGHPTLGTAFVLRGEAGTEEVVLDLEVGQVPVRFDPAEGMAAFGEMTQVEPAFGRVHERAAVAEAAGLPPEALEEDLPVQTVSTGIPFTIVPLRSLETLSALRVDVSRVAAYLSGSGVDAFYFVTRDTRDPAVRLRARMMFYGGEDPATGSAAGCAAAYLVAHGAARPDERVTIEQGREALRPSRIYVRASRSGARVHDVRVGGQVVEVLRGEVRL